jgi:hypothetical protein
MALFSDEWEQQIYTSAYDDAYARLVYLKENDPRFTFEALEHMLDTKYSITGDDYGGKGSMQKLKERGEITAYEIIYQEWREERTKQKQKEEMEGKPVLEE